MTLKESSLDPKHAVFDEVVPPGRGFAREVTRGQIVRIVDLEGNQAVDTLFYSARSRRALQRQRREIQKHRCLHLDLGRRRSSAARRGFL